MAEIPEHERIAMEKHRELMQLPKLGVRLVDHNLSEHLAKGELSRGGAELNLVDGFKGMLNLFGEGKEPADFLHGASNVARSLTNWDEYCDYLAVLSRLYRDFDPDKKETIPKLRNLIVTNRKWQLFIENLPEKCDKQSLEEAFEKLRQRRRELEKEPDAPGSAWQKLHSRTAALFFARYAPHHIEILRRFTRDRKFGKTAKQRDQLVRALAYFEDHHVISHEHSPALHIDGDLTPYSYNAATLIHEHRVGGQGYWPTVIHHPQGGSAVHGVLVLEPSVHAAEELAQRLTPHWKNKPQDAFPIYDWRGNRIWPPEPKTEKKK